MKVLNTATCTHCHSRNTVRGGFVKEKSAALWRCKDAECGKTFYVVTYVLFAPPA